MLRKMPVSVALIPYYWFRGFSVYYHPIAIAPFSQIETWGNNRISGERLTDDVWIPQLALYSRHPQLFRHLWTNLHVNTCQVWQVIVIYILNLLSLVATSNNLGFWWNRGARQPPRRSRRPGVLVCLSASCWLNQPDICPSVYLGTVSLIPFTRPMITPHRQWSFVHINTVYATKGRRNFFYF